MHRSSGYWESSIDNASRRRSTPRWTSGPALGVTAQRGAHQQYTGLSGAIPGLHTVIQAVDDAPRDHLDIETDDLAAEVARLTALGAEPVSRWEDAFVLRAPGGHLLCVVPLHDDPETFASSARTWQ